MLSCFGLVVAAASTGIGGLVLDSKCKKLGSNGVLILDAVAVPEVSILGLNLTRFFFSLCLNRLLSTFLMRLSNASVGVNSAFKEDVGLKMDLGFIVVDVNLV